MSYSSNIEKIEEIRNRTKSYLSAIHLEVREIINRRLSKVDDKKVLLIQDDINNLFKKNN